MRRAGLVALLLAACAMPSGTPLEVCDASWRDVEAVIVREGGTAGQPVSIDCARRIDERRIRLGFVMPPGPTCHRLDAVEVIESADAVEVTLMLAPDAEVAGGACPEEAARTVTEIDLQAPVADREILDGSKGD